MNQRQRVLNTLRRAPDGVCARWFTYEAYPGIGRPAARIHELRDEGWPIVTERCDLPHYGNTAAHIKYRLEGLR